ncbi:MAG TPA: hypothetical protein PK228_05095 [Saprospiraceae bacterium]|nr:hypothetical protein [Saprospiraceae bacterium]
MALISSADHFSTIERASSRPLAFHGIDTQLIRCDIVFGMPSQDCRGTGICKLSSDVFQPDGLNKECRRTVAFASRTDGGQQLSLVFFRELLCINLYRHHFHKGVLEMTEPCPLPAELIADLGLEGDMLLPGRYLIQEYEGCYRVDISCV